MICFRARPDFADDWTLGSFEGEDEMPLALIVLAVLRRQGWEILVSTDGGEEVPLDEM